MPSKTEEYLALAQRTANGLTRYWESWTAYLTTASRLYKYRFEDQLMIYAQRPDATACADYDIWNNRMNRYVRRGSKGIALLDESSGYPRLHYVFDVSDIRLHCLPRRCFRQLLRQEFLSKDHLNMRCRRSYSIAYAKVPHDAKNTRLRNGKEYIYSSLRF